MAKKLRYYKLDSGKYFVGQNPCKKIKKGVEKIVMNPACVIGIESFSEDKTTEENIKELYFKTDRGLRQFPFAKISKNYKEIILN